MEHQHYLQANQDGQISPLVEDNEGINRQWEQRSMISSTQAENSTAPSSHTNNTQWGHGDVAHPQSTYNHYQVDDRQLQHDGQHTSLLPPQIICYNYNPVSGPPSIPNHPSGPPIPPHSIGSGPGSQRGPDSTASGHGSVWKAWILELISTFVALGLLIAQYVILRVYDATPTLDWTIPISLNALVAVLSTIARAILTFIATEIIAQIMWTFTNKSLSLRNLEDFNQATRGAWSALKLPFIAKRVVQRPDLVAALIVVVVSLLMGPFSQQAVGIKKCVILESNTASLPNVRTIGYLDFSDMTPERTTFRRDPVDFKAGFLMSLANPEGDHSTLQAPTCSTGNCTFPQYTDSNGAQFTHRSMGFCSSCIDSSEHIKAGEPVAQMWVGGPQAINGTVGVMKVNDTFLMYNWTHPSSTGGIGVRGRFSRPELDDLRSKNFSQWKLQFPQTENLADWKFLQGHLYRVWTRTYALPEENKTDTIVNAWRGKGVEMKEFERNTRSRLLLTDFLSMEALSIKDGMVGANPPEFPVSATTCALYPCIKTYLASIEQGNVTEKLISTDTLPTYGIRLPYNSSTPGSDSRYSAYQNAEAIAVRTPCVVGSKIYTAENISTAPGAITLERWNYGEREMWSNFKYNIEVSEPNWRTNCTAEVKIIVPPECIYAMDLGHWYSQMQLEMEFTLQGECLYASEGQWFNKRHRFPATSNTMKGDNGLYSFSMHPFWLDGIAQLPRRSRAELTDYMERVAESFTRVIRINKDPTWGRDLPGNGWRRDASKEMVTGGEVWWTTTCFEMNFKWLGLPTVVTVLTLFTPLWTMARGIVHKDPVWKTSILPLIYYQDRLVMVEPQNVPSAQPMTAPLRESAPLMSEAELAKDSTRVSVILDRTGAWKEEGGYS